MLYSAMVDFIIEGQFEKLKKELNSLHGERYINMIIKLGSVINKNKNYSYVNELLSDLLKDQIKSKHSLKLRENGTSKRQNEQYKG